MSDRRVHRLCDALKPDFAMDMSPSHPSAPLAASLSATPRRNGVELTVVVPTYNESENVPILVERLAGRELPRNGSMTRAAPAAARATSIEGVIS